MFSIDEASQEHFVLDVEGLGGFAIMESVGDKRCSRVRRHNAIRYFILINGRGHMIAC